MKTPFCFSEFNAVGVRIDSCDQARELIKAYRTAYLYNEQTDRTVLVFRSPANDCRFVPGIQVLKAEIYPPQDELPDTQVMGDIHALVDFPAEWIDSSIATVSVGEEIDQQQLHYSGATFLESLFGGSISLVTSFEPDGGPRDSCLVDPSSYSTLAEFLDEQASLSRNLYFGLNGLEKEGFKDLGRPKAKKEDIVEILGLHSDLDPIYGAATDAIREDKELFLTLIPESVRPSIVIDSGNGLQPIWLLEHPLDLRGSNDRDSLIQRVEDVNKALSLILAANLNSLKADHVQNIDRILRVPGTINFPNAKKRAAGRIAVPASLVFFDKDRRFALEDLELLIRDEFPAYGFIGNQTSKSNRTSSPTSVVNTLDLRRRATAYLNANASSADAHSSETLANDLALIEWHLASASKGDGRSHSSQKIRRLWKGDFSEYPGNSEGMMALLAILAAELPGLVTVDRLYQLATHAKDAVSAYNQFHSADKWARRGQEDCAKAIGFRHAALEQKVKLKQEAEEIGEEIYLAAVGSGHGGEAVVCDDQIPRHQIDATDRFTDLANAQRLVHHYGDDLLFLDGKTPLQWDGRCWAKDASDLIGDISTTIPMKLSRLIEDHEISLLRSQIMETERTGSGNIRELENLLEDYEEWQKESESRKHIDAAAKLFQKLLTVPSDRINKNWMTLVCENGTVELETGEFRPSRRKDLDTRMVAVQFDPEASCPRFLKFMDEVFVGDSELVRYVQQIFGYALLGEVREHILPIFYGEGRNGKGTLLGLFQRILGPYGTTIPAEALVSSKKGSTDSERANVSLHGKRVAIAQETESCAYLDESWIKTVTGGDRLAARKLYAEAFDFVPQHTLFLASNHRPQIHGKDDGVWGRVRLIPFRAQFMKDKEGANAPDPNLGEKLWGERDGIFIWLLEGLKDYLENGLVTPEEVLGATAEYREDEDRMILFLQEWMRPNPVSTIPISDVFKEFKRWSESEEGARLTMKRKAFVEAITRTLRNSRHSGEVKRCSHLNQKVLIGWAFNTDRFKTLGGGGLPSGI
jgi:P4 family phage/plasmid primase-like protien